MDDHFFDALSESATESATESTTKLATELATKSATELATSVETNKNENKLLFSKLKESKTIQVDLNIEKNLSELEDPILIQHIADSRKKLEEYTKKNQENIIKTKEILNNELTEFSKKSSQNISILNKINSSLSNNIEYIIVQYSNIKKLKNDEVPYGYPALEYTLGQLSKKSFQDNLDYLAKKLETPIDHVIDSNTELLELEKSINVTARNYNILISKLFDFNQTLLETNEKLLEKLFKYENDTAEPPMPTSETLDLQAPGLVAEAAAETPLPMAATAAEPPTPMGMAAATVLFQP
jgi:hypothetical protein